MFNYLVAMGLILLIMLGWILVQHAARLFAARHPEFGPAKEEGVGCGKSCGCSGKRACEEEKETD